MNPSNDSGRLHSGARRTALRAAILAAVLLSGGASSAGPLLDIYGMALEDDPAWLAAQRQAEGAAETLVQARALWRPAVSASAAVGPSLQNVYKSPGSLYRTNKVNYRAREHSFNITQALLNAGHAAAGELADARMLQVQAELRSQQQDLIQRVAERYFGAVALSESARAILSEVDALSRHLSEVRRRRAAGLVRRTDLLEAESRLAEAEARQVEVQIRYLDALRSLAELSGRRPERLGMLGERQVPPLPLPADPVHWTEQAEQNNPLIEARRHALSVAEAEVRRQASAHYPTLDLALRAGRNYGSESLYGGPSDIANKEIRLNLSVPIYSGGMVSSREREAAKAAERAAEDLRAQQRNVERSVRGTYDRINGANVRIEALLKSQRLIEEALSVKRAAYANGLVTGLAVIDAERDLNSVRSELARARYDFMLGLLNLKRAAGLLNESDVQELDALLDREITVPAELSGS